MKSFFGHLESPIGTLCLAVFLLCSNAIAQNVESDEKIETQDAEVDAGAEQDLVDDIDEEEKKAVAEVEEISIISLPQRKKPVISRGSPFIGESVQQLTLNEDFQDVFFEVFNKNKPLNLEVENDTLGLIVDKKTGVVYFTPTREDEIGVHSVFFKVKHRGKTYEHQVDFIIQNSNL